MTAINAVAGVVGLCLLFSRRHASNPFISRTPRTTANASPLTNIANTSNSPVEIRPTSTLVKPSSNSISAMVTWPVSRSAFSTKLFASGDVVFNATLN